MMRYSIAFRLAIGFALANFAAPGCSKTSEQEQAQAVLDGLGATAEYRQVDGLGRVFWVELMNTEVVDDDLKEMIPLPIGVLSLYGSRVTDKGLEYVAQMPQLKALALDKVGISDAGLDRLSGLDGLVELHLSHTQVSDAGLLYLQNLDSLRSLNLGHTRVTDRGLEQLSAMSNLRELYLNGAPVTADSIERLKGELPELEVYSD